MSQAIEERRADAGGVEVFWREAPTVDGRAPAVYVHGVPTNSDDFVEFLERTGGLAPDLPGFGRSGKPANFDYSIDGYSDFIESFLATAGVARCSLVVHDWGAAALGFAQRAPERIERLVVIDSVPLLPGYRWHRIARIWRTPLLGELAMGASTRWGFRQLSREGFAGKGPAPDHLVDRAWDHFDHGTQRAILRLYRSAPPELLARAGRRLGDLRCPALVVWGAEDPYLSTSFAHAYGEALGGESRVEIVDGARHWPWIDRPRCLAAITEFLLA